MKIKTVLATLLTVFAVLLITGQLRISSMPASDAEKETMLYKLEGCTGAKDIARL